MEIILAGRAGYCYGVKRAMRMAREAARQGGRVYSLGPLIHNPRALKPLEREGLRIASSLDEVKEGTVIIRTHGVPPGVLEEARKRGLEVVDATCPYVSRAQEAARKLQEEGYQVVVVGQAQHPEVQGLLGWTDGQAIVVENVSEAEALPPCPRIGVVSQTTQREEVLRQVVEVLRSKAGELKVANTICTATSRRQEEARRLAEKVEVMLVIGSQLSSNTRKLADICRESGAETYLIEEAGDIRPAWLAGKTAVGITAGASTPDWIIKGVRSKVEELRETDGEGMEQAGLATLEVGDLVRGKVVNVGTDSILVDVGYKSEGIIPLRELSQRPVERPDQVVRPGEDIEAVVLKVNGQEGTLILSKRRADEERAWKGLQEALDRQYTIEAPVIEEVKGGLVVDVGVRGFVPASQVERGYVSNLTKYVGTNLRLKVLELDRAKRRAVLSRKLVLEEEQRLLKERTWENLEEGQVRKGVVKNVTDFGAFIDLGGVDGLLHVSEMSWGRVEHPSQVVKEGDTIEVKVLRVDREKEKISLGLKQVLPDPWENVIRKYPVGSVVNGKVVRTVGFGAFVELEPGVEGLVHISQLADRRVARTEDVVQPGDDIRVKVLKVDPAERRISLSLKEADQERDRNLARQYTPDREREGVTIGDVYGDLLEETKERLNEERRD